MTAYTIHITPASMSLDILLRKRLIMLSSNGFSVTGYSTDDEYGKRFASSGFNFIGSKYLTRSFSLFKDFLFMYECYKTFRREKPQIINTYGPKPGLYARISARLAGVPVIVHTSWGFFFSDDDTRIKKICILLIERLSSLFCDYIFSVNKDDISLMHRYHFLSSDRIGYLGNGTDVTDTFNPDHYPAADTAQLKSRYGLQSGNIVVGMIGRLTKSKGYREFFEVAKSITHRRNDVTFIVIGPYDFTRGDGITKQDIIHLEKKGVIKYLGLVDHGKMPDVLSMLDIVVLPSYREGFPRSLVEAAAMGIPLIASDIRGCREAIDHGINGFLVPKHDIISLENSVQLLIDDASLRQRMGEMSRKKAMKDFDEIRLVEKIVATYQSLLDTKLQD